MRVDGRRAMQLRPITIVPDFTQAPLASVLINWGKTRVLCTASLEDRLPPWLRNSDQGWVTAEYAMLPGATAPRNRREGLQGKVSGRTQEIQRLIARSLRQAVDLKQLGQRQITVDCDVLQADGGTRTAAITGGYVALRLALGRLIAEGTLPETVVTQQVAALSIGILEGVVLTDLEYREDSGCDVDANFVLASDGGFIEIQGTGEKSTFSRDQLNEMLDHAQAGAKTLFALQVDALRQSGVALLNSP
jgi:ribonuclease PH